MDRSGGGDESVAEWSLGVRGRQMRVARGRELSTETEAHKLGLFTVMDTTADDVLQIVYLLANRIALAHEGLELGIGEALIINLLAEAYGRTKVGLRKLYNQLGDWGLVAKACRSSLSMMSKPNALTVTKVFNIFHLIAKESGKDSQEKKKKKTISRGYLLLLPIANLRIGLAEQTLLATLGQAAVYAHSTPLPNIQSPLEEWRCVESSENM
nr:isoform 2 of dna ligase 1 [Quercus suber]